MAATVTELTAAGVESSALGHAALLLARRLEDGVDGGSAVASLAKQWADLMGRATSREVVEAADPLDELAEARVRRRGNVG